MPKISARRGGYFWLGFSLFLLFFTINPLFSQSKPNYKKIYFENLETGNGVRPEIATRVRNQVSLNILRYFKSKYTFIDDSVVRSQLSFLKKQQNLGCDTDKCYKMIEDNLSPDEKITGNLQMSLYKFSLTIKLIDLNQQGGVVEQKEIKFTTNQLDYYVGEITRSILDSNYTINIAKAPIEFEPQKVELGSLQIKEIEGVDLKIFQFKTQDSMAKKRISVLNSELQKADSQFRNRKFDSALKMYLNIQETLDNSLSEDSKFAVQEYYSGVQKRIENTKTNLVLERLKDIDSRFNKLPISVNLESLEQFIQEYTKESLFMNDQKNSPLVKSISDRIQKLEMKILEINEKEAQFMLTNFNFSDSRVKLESIQTRIRSSGRIDEIEKEKLLLELDRKISVISETEISYYSNQIRLYCNLAEKEILLIKYKREKGENLKSNILKIFIDNARLISEKNISFDKATKDYYSSTLQAYNLLYKTEATPTIPEKNKNYGETLKINTSLVEKIHPNIYLPGSLHKEFGEIEKSNIIRYSFFGSLTLFLYYYASYQSNVKAYTSKDQPAFDYLVVKTLPSETGLLYIYSQSTALDTIRDDGLKTAQIGNTFGMLALGLYLYSWTPIFSGAGTKSAILNDNWNFVLLPKITISREGIPNREFQFGLEGRF